MIKKIYLVFGFVMLLCAGMRKMVAQDPGSGDQFFRINVQLNGKAITAPTAITLKTKQKKSTVGLEQGCFRLPSELTSEKAVDVSFIVPGNRIYLSRIATGFLSGRWDIDLQDKKFPSDVTLPKGATPKEACTVVFHVGEPETKLVQTGCRKPLHENKNGQIWDIHDK